MNRLTALKTILLGSSALLSLDAKSKKDDKKKKDSGSSQEEKKIVGTISLSVRGITKSYKLLGNKTYSISRSLVGKVAQYEGEEVTIYGTIAKSRIVKISGIVKGADTQEEKE